MQKFSLDLERMVKGYKHWHVSIAVCVPVRDIHSH